MEVYSQEKNKLFLHFPSDNDPYRNLIISTNPQFPYLLIKNNHHKAKKNVVDFFSDYLPAKLNDIKIATNDRLIKMNFISFNLYFSISGSKTNVYLDSESKIVEFKKSKEGIEQKIKNMIFTNDIDLTFSLHDRKKYEQLTDLKKDFPMISSEIKKEVILRSSYNHSKNLLEVFKQVTQQILTSKIKVGLSTDDQKIVFIPESFKSITFSQSFELFTNYNDALQYYLSSFYKQEKSRDINKELDKYFDKELSSLANKLNKLSSRIDSGSNEQKYYNQANLLLTNIYKLKKGMDEIIINDNQIDTSIKLDPKLSPNENIEKYFEKAKGEKLNFNKSVELFNFTKQKYDLLNADYKRFKQLDKIDEIEALHNKLIQKKEKAIKMDSGLKFKYWHYLIDDKYHVYIGRDSKSNDYLSLKFAKQNDYWFHTRGLPGSHVVLRVDNVKEGVPKDIIKKAASLAGYYSKAKTAGSSPISYTLAKFVHKKKGMEPGKVLLQKEQTLLVKPEIPKNCILVDE